MCFVAITKLRVKTRAAVWTFRSMLNRRQRREFEQKAAKETKVNQGLGLCHGHPVGPSAFLQSSSRLKWCGRMRRPMPVCLPIGLVFLRRGCEPLPSMLNRRQRREFEQKAAKETKVNQGWASVMVIRLGLWRLSNRPRGLNGAAECGGPCRFVFRSASSFCDAAVNRFHQCSTEGSEEKFEQKVAKETKVNQGLGLCHGHPVRTSASLQSSSSSLRSRRTRSRHIGRSPSSGHRGKRRPADTLIRAPCVWATALKHRERLENPRVAEGPSECSSRKPNPQCAFVSFAAFCSNFLRCLLSSIDPSGSSCATKLDADSRHADTRRCI